MENLIRDQSPEVQCLTSPENLSLLRTRIPQIEAQVMRQGRVSRSLAYDILINLAHRSHAQAIRVLNDYFTAAQDAFRRGSRKKISVLLRDLDWTFAVSTQFFCAKQLVERARIPKTQWGSLIEFLSERTIPALGIIPHLDFQRALKEVERHCLETQRKQRMQFELKIRPFELASLALLLEEDEPFDEARELLYKAHCALGRSERVLQGPPYSRIPLDFLAPRRKPRLAKGNARDQQTVGATENRTQGFLGPIFVETLKRKIWGNFSPVTALEVLSSGYMTKSQVAKLLHIRQCENLRHTEHLHAPRTQLGRSESSRTSGSVVRKHSLPD